MKILLNQTPKLICLVLFVCLVNSCLNASSQSLGMREVENISQAAKQAPTECLTVFREFFGYVQKAKPDIVTDEQAQNRWLTKWMRTAFVKHIKRSAKPEENPDYPSNRSFVGVWNKPTTYSIVGSRHYDFHNADNPNDNRVIIDVLYEWDTQSDGINNQYPGEKQLFSFIFVFEDESWKLDDIYTFDDEYASPSSLREYFERLN